MTTSPIKTLRTLRSRLKKALPAKISQVMQSYEDFSNLPVPEDAKGFTAHHNACKSAVVHAETLIKLARWTEGEDPGTAAAAPLAGLEKLLMEAHAAETGETDEDD